jgi:hypothetical protein
MTRTSNIRYGESVLYSCDEIITLPDMVSFVGSSREVTFLLTVRGPVARLNMRNAVVISSCATLPNSMNACRPLVKLTP